MRGCEFSYDYEVIYEVISVRVLYMSVYKMLHTFDYEVIYEVIFGGVIYEGTYDVAYLPR